jgi:hypothetical protein
VAFCLVGQMERGFYNQNEEDIQELSKEIDHLMKKAHQVIDVLMCQECSRRFRWLRNNASVVEVEGKSSVPPQCLSVHQSFH